MPESSKAVFLSYASEDIQAARRICDALRAAGIEVWFDQSELRGGDVWDRQIRQQIHDCALFIPVISSNTQARLEGYFRLEWRLAVERTHLMADRKTFLVPVVIDATNDEDAEVPETFRAVQWTRLPGGETPPALVERVARILAHDPHASPSLTRPLSTSARTAGASSWPKFVLLLIGCAAVIGGGYRVVDRLVLSKRPADAKPSSAPAVQSATPTPRPIPAKSVAVLPFTDMSEKKDQEYFSDGLSEELIDMLSKVPDLRVPARTSSFYFKGKSEDIATIAQRLHVANVLEGSVRKAGDRLRITAQLIRADNGYHLWSETYDRDAKDIFKVQDEIAGAVVDALKAKLAPAQSLASSRTAKPEAYNQLLLGRQFFNRGTLDNFRRAAEAYGKAIALDPKFAAAYAGLADAESRVADFTGDAAGLKRAEAAAEKAIALAPEEADGYVTRGLLRSSYSWDWAGAQADLAKALAINPTNSTVQRHYGALLESLGRLPEAIAAARKAIELDPLSNSAWQNLGGYLMYSGDYPAAGDALHRSLEIQPDSVYTLINLGILQLLEGKAAEALAMFRKNTSNAFKLYGISMAEHSLGHVRESQQALKELIAKEAQEAAYQIAEVFAWRGEKDKAFEWLERAYRQRDGGLSDVKLDPLLASLRGDPRYTALLRKLKLPE